MWWLSDDQRLPRRHEKVAAQRPDFVYDIKAKSNNLEKMPLPSSNSFDGISEEF